MSPPLVSLTLLALALAMCAYAEKQALILHEYPDRVTFVTPSYDLRLNRVMWHRAYNACQADDSYLVVINTPHEITNMEDIIVYYTDVPGRHTFFHVGAHDLYKDNTWVSVRGDHLKDTAFEWAPGEPNQGPEENCAAVTREVKMYDLSCDNAEFWYPFICEYDY